MIRVFEDLEALSRTAAQLFVETLRMAGSRREPSSVVLAGGTTPRREYELLATAPYRDRVDWERIHVFWSDERCLPPGDPRRNEVMARATLLDRVPIPPG